MPWLVKALLVALRTKRGRELLFAGSVGAIEIVQSDRARKLYARAWQLAANPRPRKTAARFAKNAAARVKR